MVLGASNASFKVEEKFAPAGWRARSQDTPSKANGRDHLAKEEYIAIAANNALHDDLHGRDLTQTAGQVALATLSPRMPSA